MRKQFIFMFLASMAGGAIATVLMQQKNPFAVWAASGTRAIVLSRDAVCPPGFSDITNDQHGRYLLADKNANGVITQGGSILGPINAPSLPGGHQLIQAQMPQHVHYMMNWHDMTSNGGGGFGLGAGGYHPHGNWATSNAGGNEPHNHPYSGFRLCEWTVN